MKTPREILLRRHQAASPKLDAIRAGVVADIAPKTISWRELVRLLRWHLAGLGAAWVVVLFLNTDLSGSSAGSVPRAALAEPSQIWASLRERRRLLLQYSEAPAAEPSAAPGRRSEMEPKLVVV
jgi:hypothetical protein